MRWLENARPPDGEDDSMLDEAVVDYLVGVLTEDDLPAEEAVVVLGSYLPSQTLAVEEVHALREELWRLQRQRQEEEEEEKAAASVVQASAATTPAASGGEVHPSHHDEEDEEDEVVVGHGHGYGGQEEEGEEEGAELLFLQELVPSFPKDLIRFVWAQRCHGDQTMAAQVMVENCSEEGVRELRQEKEAWESRQEALAEKEKGMKEAARARIRQRYADQVVEAGDQVRPLLPLSNNKPHDKKHGGGKDRLRFRDGMVVSTKGEKFVVEKGEEWDGGSRGKVITKGKRGKGFR